MKIQFLIVLLTLQNTKVIQIDHKTKGYSISSRDGFLQNNMRINVMLNMNVKIDNLNELIYVLIKYFSGLEEFHQG